MLDIKDVNTLKIYNNEYNIKLLLKQINITFKNKVNDLVTFKMNVNQSIPEFLYGDSITLKEVISCSIDYSINKYYGRIY